MPRKCAICQSPQRSDIDSALGRNDSTRSIATRFRLSQSSVMRHKRNCIKEISDSVQITTQVENNDSVNRKETTHPKDNDSPPAGFAEFYAIWPRKVAKQAAERAYRKQVTSASRHETLMVNTKLWLESWRREDRSTKFIPHPATYLNRGDWHEPPPEPEELGQREPGPSSEERQARMEAWKPAMSDAKLKAELEYHESEGWVGFHPQMVVLLRAVLERIRREDA